MILGQCAFEFREETLPVHTMQSARVEHVSLGGRVTVSLEILLTRDEFGAADFSSPENARDRIERALAAVFVAENFPERPVRAEPPFVPLRKIVL